MQTVLLPQAISSMVPDSWCATFTALVDMLLRSSQQSLVIFQGPEIWGGIISAFLRIDIHVLLEGFLWMIHFLLSPKWTLEVSRNRLSSMLHQQKTRK